ncbi:MAG: hypothetical protein LUE86_10965 [Clostridiales bacterium]|nr:hypothetical protein [Clostridiales bacterium]
MAGKRTRGKTAKILTGTLTVLCLSGAFLTGCASDLTSMVSEMLQESGTETGEKELPEKIKEVIEAGENEEQETVFAMIKPASEVEKNAAEIAETETENETEIKTETTVASETEMEAEAEPEPEPIVENPENPAAWEAYEKFLRPKGLESDTVYNHTRGYGESYLSESPVMGFALVDIDRNGIDELIVVNSIGSDICEIYTYYSASEYGFGLDESNIHSLHYNSGRYNRGIDGHFPEGSGYISEESDLITDTGVFIGSICFSRDCIFYGYLEDAVPISFQEFVSLHDDFNTAYERGFNTCFYGKPVFDPATGLVTEFYSWWQS